MAKFIDKVGIYRIYELSEKECQQHFREYPTFVCCLSSHHEEIGNMNQTENETGTIEEMTDWCKKYS